MILEEDPAAAPGHEHSGVHRGYVVLPPRDLVVAEVPGTPVFFILPLAEALQGPFTMVADREPDLKGSGEQ